MLPRIIMRIEKQMLWLEAIANGKYRIGALEGTIQRLHKKTNQWKTIIVAPLPSGYVQYGLKYNKTTLWIYGHVAVWIGVNGEYPEGMIINHNDFNRSNNAINNLSLCNQSQDIKYSRNARRYPTTNKLKRFSPNEVGDIRFFLKDGLTQAGIAKKMGMKRISVAYVCRKIKAGKKLRCES